MRGAIALLRSPFWWKYAAGSVFSWVPYFALLELLHTALGMWHLAASGLSWFASYCFVFAVQKLRQPWTIRELAIYKCAVTMPSGVVNFGLLALFASYTSTNQRIAEVASATVAMCIAAFASKKVLRP